MNSGDLVGGKYRLTQRLGAGAMGTVWASINERTGRKVALKLILHPTDDLRYRLLREARACGSLEHRNIVEIYDVGETKSGDPFLVMQLLTGETLADLLSRRRTIQPQPTAGIGRDIASALAAAHEARIVHRDLKPANIFLYREGGHGSEDDFVLKVLDFGVSKNLASGDGHATVTGMMVGSPAYMSPEQIRMAKDVDHRTDIWSLGIILFELLTGTRPFVGMSEEIVRQILAAPIPTVSSRMRHVPPELDAIVTRCLSRNRDERYHDTKELVRTLAAYAEISQAARRVVNVPVASDSEADTLVAQPAILQQREAPQSPAHRAYPAVTSAREDLPPAGFPTETQLLSPTDQRTSMIPAWRRQVQQALAANRQALEPPEGVLTADPVQAATTAESVALSTGAPAPYAKVPVLTALQAQPANAGRPPEASSGSDAVKTPIGRRATRLYAITGAGITMIAALGAVLALRKDPPRGPLLPTDQSAKSSVSTADRPATSAPSTVPDAVQTALPIPEPVPELPRIPTVSKPVVPPPPPKRSVLVAATENQLQPCTRFIKKNCRPGRPP